MCKVSYDMSEFFWSMWIELRVKLVAISDISFSLPLDGSDRLIRYQSSKSKHLLLHPIVNKHKTAYITSIRSFVRCTITVIFILDNVFRRGFMHLIIISNMLPIRSSSICFSPEYIKSLASIQQY
jgi:hypothetical protein